jgi:hypothetical protein
MPDKDSKLRFGDVIINCLLDCACAHCLMRRDMLLQRNDTQRDDDDGTNETGLSRIEARSERQKRLAHPSMTA